MIALELPSLTSSWLVQLSIHINGLLVHIYMVSMVQWCIYNIDDIAAKLTSLTSSLDFVPVITILSSNPTKGLLLHIL